MYDLSDKTSIAVIGLGYVGLPVALAFSKRYPTLAFDINPLRIKQLRQGIDNTGEVDADEILNSSNLALTHELNDLRDTDVLVVTVPTPINENNLPDLSLLERASSDIGKIVHTGSIVVFESTVFPGATEEICVPLIEGASGLKLNLDFYVGYSPERINPGDNVHRLESVVKVTSGSTSECAEFVDKLYRSIVKAGTHKAPSIRIAEAAKVIENIQRDLNIALVNEFARVFEKLDIDTGDVLDAASTKWNFLPFRPGLVGGHCIGVDPYYLTYKANSLGYNPEVILAGRKMNNDMPRYIAERIHQLLSERGSTIRESKVLVLGITFKENCPDIRNSKAVDLVSELQRLRADVDVYDPVVNLPLPADMRHVKMIDSIPEHTYDAVVAAVAHSEFVEMSPNTLRSFARENAVIYDVKHCLDREIVTSRL